MNLQHQQYMTDISSNNRPQQQSSPSDNSMSTATPPHQTSRASPASTALVMSNNNINGAQPTSRQLTPNTFSSNNGTGSSSNGSAGNHCGPPNPMIRQFACHAKSMSAGVEVSVPGMTNNLATATGMNQNNMINNHIAHNNNNSATNNQNRMLQMNTNSSHPHPHPHVRSNSHHQQQVIKEYPRGHHYQQNSQPATNTHYHQQQTVHPYNAGGQNGNGSNNFIKHTNSSSIILSNNNINNLHNRSASTHLPSHLLGPQANSHLQSNQNYPPQVANSLWSIGENISKSHGKLTSNGYFPSSSYMYNPSITDVSCDNVSNVSRLIDGPAPGYYLQTPSNLPNTNAISTSGSLKASEFLPICDLLFNLISMILYFCESIFGIIALIALYYHTTGVYWALLGGSFVISSNVASQYLSFKWLYKAKLEDCRRKREAQEELENEENCERRYYNRMASNMRNYQCGSCAWLPDSATEVQLKFLLSIAIDAILHIFCLGFLVRYIKLVIPVKDTARVKKEARDLCMLRMTHSFIQSAPLLLLQAYIICSQTSSSSITNLSATSIILSLLSVCWALASFTKYARKKYMHKFVLTWLGIISQLLWRLGTISSRVVALTIYAVYYNYCMLIVLSLHWLTMFFWLIKPGNLLKDEVNLSRPKKVLFAMATAWIYCFCYMNFEEVSSKQLCRLPPKITQYSLTSISFIQHNSKMTIYYVIMFLENNLLLTMCLICSSQVTWFKNLSILVIYLGFVFGMLFMFLYYKYFHVNVLNNGFSCSQDSIDSIADQLSPAGKKIAGFKPGTLRLKSEDKLSTGHRYNSNIGATLNTGSHPEITRNIKQPYLEPNHLPFAQSGVYNCKTSQCFKKQKIPSTQVRRHNM